MRLLVGVMVGGALGAAARYGLDGLISDWTGGAFPWGTFVVNISGSLLLGFLYTVFVDRFSVDPVVRTAVTVGFIGSFTTFSTLTLETLQLMQDRSYPLALANAGGGLLAGLLAVGAGTALGRTV